MRLLRSLSPRQVDALIAAILLVGGEIEAALVAEGWARVFAMTMVAIMAGSVAFRRRAPLPALVVFFLAGVPMTFAISDTESFAMPFLAVLLWGYTFGSLSDLRTALIGLGILVVGICCVSIAFDEQRVGDFIFPIGFASAAWGGGRAIRHRTHLAAELHEAAVRADEEREEASARAVADERRRIAREMHDVVAHSVSVMVVQAGGARRILERDPARAAEAARLIERTGRDALVEMRRLLGVLGTADDSPAMAPQPTLDELSGLVGRASEAGLPVSLEVEGERRPLPAGAEAAVYRVVQEALTNVLKHAGSAPTDVVLHWGDEGLEVLVSDRGNGSRAPHSLPSGGHGIVGMQERVRIYGGELTARPAPDGGFVVRARIPLHQSELQVA